MPLQLRVSNAAGFLVALVVVSMQGRCRSQEIWNVPALRSKSPARELASVHKQIGGLERSLARGPKGRCITALLDLLEPKMREWRKCFQTKAAAANQSVAGALFGANLECWCDVQLQDILVDYGCCDRPEYGLLCKSECAPNCSMPEAQQCLKDCPAVCLEQDYAPDFCGKSCADCKPYMRCIADHSANMTEIGHDSHPFICDDVGFDRSTQWEAWKKCYVQHPKRTHWHRHNAENHCFCESDLKTAAQTHHCCDAKWGKTICDEQCATAQSNINCSSAEAISCVQDCTQTCAKLYTSEMTTECQRKCFALGSQCAKYSVCKPIGPFQFDYVCDDGKAPLSNGCCPFGASMVSCPTLCKKGTPHYPVHHTGGYALVHPLQCECLGCPSSTTAAKDKWKLTLTDDLWEHGVTELATISRQTGILGANRKMQELMAKRNDEILKAWEAMDISDGSDPAFKAKMAEISASYRKLLVAEANEFKAVGEVEKTENKDDTKKDDDAKKKDEADDDDDDDDDDDEGPNATLIIVGVSGVVGLCLTFGILALLYKISVRGKQPAKQAADPGSVTWDDGDSNVVMGRPVAAGGAGEAAQGAPVRIQAPAIGQGDSGDKPAKGA